MKIEGFKNALDAILGLGANFVESLIMKRVQCKLGNLFDLEDKSIDVSEYMESATVFSKKMVELVQNTSIHK